MAGNPNRNEVTIHDISWVGNEPLEAISSFASNGRRKSRAIPLG